MKLSHGIGLGLRSLHSERSYLNIVHSSWRFSMSYCSLFIADDFFAINANMIDINSYCVCWVICIGEFVDVWIGEGGGIDCSMSFGFFFNIRLK